MEYSSPHQEEVGLDYIQLILRRKWLIAAVTLIAAIAALIISAYQQKIYQASAILQIGSIAERNILLPGNETNRAPIEDTKTVSELLRTDAMMERLKEKLQLPETVSLSNLKNAIKVRIIKNDIVNQSTLLLEVNMTATDPQKTTAGLQFLMAQFIEEHQKRYDSAIAIFDAQLKLISEKLGHNGAQQQEIKEKIKKINEQIEVDGKYRKVVEQQLKVAEHATQETKDRLAVLDVKSVSPLEILFLQGQLRDREDQYASFQKELTGLDLGLRERQKQINDLESQIIALANQGEDLKAEQLRIENYKNLSENTRVRSTPVLPTRHISPNRRNNVVVGAGIGLLFSILIAFSLEYSGAGKPHRG